MISGGGGKSVIVESMVADEILDPSGKFTHWLSPLIPKSAGKIGPLGERDVWPTFTKKIYQTVLTYEFEQEEAGGITVRIPSLQGYIYESAYESQFCMVYDSNKRLLGYSDSYPKEVKTPKGKITIVCQVRHDDPEILSKLQDQVLWIQRKLVKNAALSCYSSHERMVKESGTFKKKTLKKGTSASVFFSEPRLDQLPKGYKQGDFLYGTVNYSSRGVDNLAGDGSKPGGFPIRYFIGPAPVKENGKAKDAEAPDERTELEKLDEALLKLKVDELKKLSTEDKEDKKFPELYEHILKSHPDHIPLHTVYMKHQDQEKWRQERIDKIIEACNSVIQQIDQNELILYYGVTGYYDKEDGAACKKRKDMDEKKDALIEALGRKCRAVADLERSKEKTFGEMETNFDKSLMELQKWVKVESTMKYAVLLLEKDLRKKRYGAVYTLLKKLLEKDGEETKGGICHLDRAELLKRRSKLFEILECDHIVHYDNAWKLVSKPKDYALF
jgi:tripeptidyl-peptidase-2